VSRRCSSTSPRCGVPRGWILAARGRLSARARGRAHPRAGAETGDEQLPYAASDPRVLVC
jgi:hypothetical protein